MPRLLAPRHDWPVTLKTDNTVYQMSNLQQRIRRRQHMEALCAATLRALSREPRLQYRGRRLCLGDTPLAMTAPHLQVSDHDDFAAYRGAADGMALRLLYSDAALHTRLAPKDDPVERLMFDWLEQLRVESLAPEHLPGLASNLVARFAAWSRAFVHGHHADGEIGELVHTVAQMSWARLTGRPVLEEFEGLIETRRGEIAPEIGTALAGLRRERRDQAAFAVHALAVAAFVAERVTQAQNQTADTAEDTDRAVFTTLLEVDDEASSKTFAAALSGQSTTLAEARQRYRVFITAYDSEQSVSRLVRAEQLDAFRAYLDAALDDLTLNRYRLARYFRARLSVAERSAWSFGEESGYIDGRRLAQIVTTPADHRVFKIEQAEPRSDAVVGFLLDCSGSMKTHSEFLALVVDRLVDALSMAGVTSEILGFTTGAWSGGRAQQDWAAAGRPPVPGRLNEVRHLVFKPANQPWRRARRDLGALLKPDLYREGIDGEAVDWACARLRARPEGRRILVVISDGCPMDSATQLANDRHYLGNHLQQVVARRERDDAIGIRGLGVGLDLSAFYPQSLIVDPQAPIDNRLLSEIAALIA